MSAHFRGKHHINYRAFTKNIKLDIQASLMAYKSRQYFIPLAPIPLNILFKMDLPSIWQTLQAIDV
jgi:hypothetical protein